MIENCAGHPEALKVANKNVEVNFLPEKTSSLLQPFDQGVIAVFKAKYMTQPWTTIHWMVLKVVNGFAGFSTIDQDVHHIIQLTRQVGGEGFNNPQEEEVQEEFLGHDEEELAKLAEKQSREDEEEEEGEVEEVLTLTFTNLNKGLLSCRAAVDYFFFYIDPSIERSFNFKRGMEKLVAPYKEILKELKRQAAQPPISMFFLPSSTQSPTPTLARKPQPPVHVPPPPDSDSNMDDPPPATPSSPLPLLPKQITLDKISVAILVVIAQFKMHLYDGIVMN
ncbi:tigger transposable element-derived protein 1-like [Homarus americanus]|uniref:tigger transposable element-derived protein 1-like n=1 Tax=Homarus americanus TaxID=6706 RepID=UPI001C45ED79|nr:tigger transposable element-derived protein 1-like [Homarus americanus]